MKLLALAAAALLALPAASAAARPKPRTSNAMFVCRALRDVNGAPAFARAFGAHAYRTCVARHGRATRRHRPLRLTVRGLTLTARGAATSVDGDPGCAQSDDGCALASSGRLGGLLRGTYTATWKLLWKNAAPDAAGRNCAPALGTTTLSLPGLGSVGVLVQGRICGMGAPAANATLTLNRGLFAVAGTGTGILRRASGSGSVSFIQQPGVGGAVSGSTEFAELTLTA